MDWLKQHRGFLIIVTLAAILFLNGVRAYKEFVRAESYFALGALLMIERGEWLAPHAADEQPLNKPPLTYWLIGLSYKIFGANYGAARFPSVIAALCTLAVVYFCGFQFGGAQQGIVAAAVLATSYLFLNFARTAMSDMLLTLFVTTSLTCFTILLASNPRYGTMLAVAGYAALGLGVLTKGPIALALIAVPIATELIISRDGSELRKLQLGRGLILFLIVSAPYFVIVYLRLGAGPLRFFFIGENVQRFTGATYTWSQRPLWYEFMAFFSDFAPWSLVLPIAVWLDWKRVLRADRSVRALYLWLLWTVILFSISSFKLDYYLLPAMPVAALLTARMFVRSAAKRLVKVALIVSVAMAAMVFTLQTTLGGRFAPVLPIGQLVSSVPAGRAWFTSSGATGWANDVAFNLQPPHTVERLPRNDAKFSDIFSANPDAVILLREGEYQSLAAKDPDLKILARAETYGHGGLSMRTVLHPQRETLFVIGHDR
ncbi:MAG: ArnT family glycosyltransferase [Pyrinomonadaceae bacterium]